MIKIIPKERCGEVPCLVAISGVQHLIVGRLPPQLWRSPHQHKRARNVDQGCDDLKTTMHLDVETGCCKQHIFSRTVFHNILYRSENDLSQESRFDLFG
jgi:hypothetical protein